MQSPEVGITYSWLELFRAFWPAILVMAAMIWAVIELRVRKILHERDEKLMAAMRTEFQTPLGNVGAEAMRALDKATSHEARIVELETKTRIFWGMIERSTAGLLRSQGEDNK